MKFVLLIGAALNIVGGAGILASLVVSFPFSFPKVPEVAEINPPDYMLFRLFTAGTAFCFGSMYVFLYLNPVYIMPFLVFGAALKYWAFAASLVAYLRFGLPRDILVSFGLTNLAVAVLFTAYLIAGRNDGPAAGAPHSSQSQKKSLFVSSFFSPGSSGRRGPPGRSSSAA
jgi:hypothetical protein